MTEKNRIRLVGVPLFILGPFIYSIVSSYEHAPVAAIFTSIILLWFTEALPLAVTGLLVPVLISLYGLVPAKDAFLPFGSDILFLFIGCFFLARAMQKHGWDKRMAFWILSKGVGDRSPEMLIAVIAGIGWLLSMWVSNTATCAILVPICLGIISVYQNDFASPQVKHNFTTRILLACAFASTMGGLATPIGTPPNLLAIELLRQSGIEVSFLQWMKIGIPVSILMLVSLLLILRWMFPIPRFEREGISSYFKEQLASLGPVKWEELQIAVVFTLMVLGWTVPSVLLSTWPESEWMSNLVESLSLSVVGIGASLLLFILPGRGGGANLRWKEATEIDWGTILLFGGGISLGSLLSSSGFAAAIGTAFFSAEFSLLLVIAIGTFVSILLSEFASNTASASILIPILLGSVAALGVTEEGAVLLVMASAFGASFGFMLPVSTPPNAIVYGTGVLDLRDMVRAGICFDLLGFSIITCWIFFLMLIG